MDPDPRKEIKVDLDPERGLKWIRIRPNAVDPGGSGSETLLSRVASSNFPRYFQAIQKGRQAKEMTQKDLATKINEKPQVRLCRNMVFIKKVALFLAVL